MKMFKRGNGYQTGNKKLAESLVPGLIASNKLRLHDESKPYGVCVTTMPDARLMVLNANDRGNELQTGDSQTVVFHEEANRVVVLAVPSHAKLREIASANQRAYVTWSELVSEAKKSFAIL